MGYSAGSFPPARQTARLRTATGRAGSIAATAAVVAAVAAAERDPIVVTSDPDDLAALMANVSPAVTILRV
ncbi:MAG: hypothetical protein ACR2GH_00995 [Pseudonocardia sp.]